MTKPYSEDGFSTLLDQDRTWRIREISDLKSAVCRADTNTQKVLLRSLIAICYAHWEGAVRFAATKFLEHVAMRRLRYRELDRQFLRNYFIPRLAQFSARAAIKERCDLIDEVLTAPDLQYKRANNNLINTNANLNSDVFKDICIICSVSHEAFEDQFDFIDRLLVIRRNKIAHGEDVQIGIEELNDIAARVIGLIRNFGNALENKVYQKEYRATSESQLQPFG